VLGGQIAVTQNLGKQTGTYRFTGMDGDYSATTISMTEEMMTPLDTDDCKTFIA
jgi:hypothetical protein